MTPWSRETPQDRLTADAETGKAKRVAVVLYAAGGRFAVGDEEGLRRTPDQDVMSIILAAAQRDKRFRDEGDRMAQVMSEGPDTPQRQSAVDYLRQAMACPLVLPKPAGDHVKLCAIGGI